jgi:hypothetical protein
VATKAWRELGIRPGGGKQAHPGDTFRRGKDQVTHPVRGHDDIANSVCGAIVAVVPKRRVVEQPRLFAHQVPTHGLSRAHMTAREASLFGYGGGAGWNGASCGGRVIVEHLDRLWGHGG